jgi:hypothetical protein
MLNCNRESYMVTSAAENGARRKPRPQPPIPPMNEDGHVLKSRRGLLAAGLAVAVVGAIGVASTLNAGAEQVPGDQSAAKAPVAQEADATTDASGPPPTLPWGGKPHRPRRGRDGASSHELKAQGLQVASNDNARTVEFAPKGRTTRTGVLRSEQTDVQPPSPAASTTTSGTPLAAASAAGTTTPPETGNNGVPTKSATFSYSVGSQEAVADGMYAALDIKKPVLASGEYHTLAELAVQTDDGSQTVEVGWNVDRAVNGDDDPHIFVFHWINGVPTCYNACGFVPFKGGVDAGDTLPVDTLKKFGIEHFNDAWWIAYDSTYVGKFPDKLWTSQGADFTQGEYFQAFGEVAAKSNKPCSQMGSNQVVDDEAGTGARIGSVTYINGPAVNLYMRTESPVYGMSPIKKSAKSFRYGGPGGC